MSKDLQTNLHSKNKTEESAINTSFVTPKVQTKIQSKVQSKIQPKLMKGGTGTKSSGEKLPDKVQAKMENSFGQDFSSVSVHKESSSAQDIHAKAYTQGNEVHFAPGEYNPESQSGQELIGHELTHVVQQREGKVGAGDVHGKGLEINQDAGLENEADELGKLASQGKNAQVQGLGNGIQRKEEGGGDPKITILLQDNDYTEDVKVPDMNNLGSFSYIDSFSKQRRHEYVLTGTRDQWSKVLKYADSGGVFMTFIIGFLKACNDPAWITNADPNPMKQNGKIINITRAPSSAEKLEFLKALYGVEGKSELDLVDKWHEKGLGSLEGVTTPELAKFIGKHQHMLVNYMANKQSEQHMGKEGINILAEQGTPDTFNPLVIRNMMQSAFASAVSASKAIIAQSVKNKKPGMATINSFDMVVNSAIILKNTLDSYGKNIKSMQDGMGVVFDATWNFIPVSENNAIVNSAKDYLKGKLTSSMGFPDTEDMKEQYILKYSSFVKEVCVKMIKERPGEIDEQQLTNAYEHLITGFKSFMS